MNQGHIANAHLTPYLTSKGRRMSIMVCDVQGQRSRSQCKNDAILLETT